MSQKETNMAMSRNKLQELSMTAVYDILFYIDMNHEIDIKDIVSSLCELPYEECDVYIKEIAIETVKHFPEIVAHLSQYMLKWKFTRINKLSQAILILSYVHFYFVKDTEKGVVINVAVKLAKKYLDDRDYQYINAILDKALC